MENKTKSKQTNQSTVLWFLDSDISDAEFEKRFENLFDDKRDEDSICHKREAYCGK